MNHVARFGPPPTIELRDFLPRNDQDFLDLEDELIKAGCSKSRATAILSALIRLRATGDDGLISPVRSLYRRELSKLGGPPWKGGKPIEDMVGYIRLSDVRKRGRNAPGQSRNRRYQGGKASLIGLDWAA
jgi:hypothetical protein